MNGFEVLCAAKVLVMLLVRAAVLDKPFEVPSREVLLGKGTMKWIDGAIYEGMWRFGQPCESGRLTYPNGDIYEGGWANGRRNGEGSSI